MNVHFEESLAGIAPASSRRLALHVTPIAEHNLREGHPWLFDRSIEKQRGEGVAGDFAVVFDRHDRFLAIGLYDPASPLRVRVLQHDAPATIDVSWFEQRIRTAALVRRDLAGGDTNGYRLVHGENDGMPGLVLDRYDDVLVVKLYTVAWLPHLADVLAAALKVVAPATIVLRLGRMALAGAQQAGLADGIVLHGDSDTRIVPFVENGIRFEADVLQGQKTGFFLDQRENRARVERLAAGRAQVLNVFAYSGGFSVYAARGGAAQVTSVDLSRPALIAAERHFALNSGSAAVARARHITIAGDAFVELSKMEAARQRFDLVIIDQPSFAKTAEECDKALAAYRKLTRLGLVVLRSGGVLVQSSCSSHVAADAFYATILAAARGASRPLRELERTGHPVDHPIGFPEGAYLKTLFAIAP